MFEWIFARGPIKPLPEVKVELEEVESPSWSVPYDIQPLRERLAGLPATDPLFPLLMGWFDAWAVMGAETRVSADHAAHQFVGQMNALANVKDDFRALWANAHQADGGKVRGN